MAQVDGERRAVSQADGPPVPSTATANALPGYLILYVALYLAYGTKSAYLPAFLRDHGLSIEQIGLMLAQHHRSDSGRSSHGPPSRLSGGPQAGALGRGLFIRLYWLRL